MDNHVKDVKDKLNYVGPEFLDVRIPAQQTRTMVLDQFKFTMLDIFAEDYTLSESKL